MGSGSRPWRCGSTFWLADLELIAALPRAPPQQSPTCQPPEIGHPVLCQNAALLKKTTNQQLRRPWNPRRIQGISRRRADFRPMG